MSTHTGEKLRIGILVSGFSVPRWVQDTINAISGSGFADLTIAVVDTSGCLHQPGGCLAPGFRAAPYHAWHRLDRALFAERGDALSVAARDLRHGFGRVIEVRGNSAQEAVAALQRARLDVLISFLSRRPVETVARCAKFGTWYFADTRAVDPFPRAVWASYDENGEAVCSLTLRAARGELAHDLVLHRLVSAADAVSSYRPENWLSSRKSEILVQRLSALHRYGSSILDQLDCHSRGSTEPETSETAGSLPSAGHFFARWANRALRNQIQNRRWFEQWFIAYRQSTRPPTATAELTGFTTMMPPADRFYADPFIAERGGRRFILFEDYSFAARKAVVSCVEIDGKGESTPPVTVLELPYHLSYPFVFEWKGEMYMLPETMDARSIQLYRAVDFPWNWQLETVLMQDIRAVDPTLLQHGGRLWLFAGGCLESGLPDDSLYLFYSDSLFGPWTPHPLNPIVSDIRSARPAGSLFFSAGQLMRPAQDCSRAYGWAITFNRVDRLSETEYREQPVAKITPDWYPGNLGTHTFDQGATLQVLDGRVLARRSELRKKLAS